MSLFTNKNFSDFWNEISGRHGQTYKEYILDPAMLKLCGDLKGKSILDLGCGNGYMGRTFLKKGCKQIILADLSKHNLENAKKLNPDKKVELLQMDATRKWKIKSNSLNVIYSDMKLNEIKNILTPVREAFRTLKENGLFILAVTHPA